MLQRTLIFSFLICFALCGAKSRSNAQEAQRGTALDPNTDKLRQAKELYLQAAAWEDARDFDHAVECYRKIEQLFPSDPLMQYRLGICLQRLGHRDEAIKVLREFLLQTDYNERDLADGQARLQELLLPTLNGKQREKWNEAADNLQVASDMQRKIASDVNNPPQLQSAKKAVELLVALKNEVPDYLPIYARLGYAFQLMGEFRLASAEYANYLDGFEKLDFVPQDRREIRRQKITCDETLALKQHDEEVRKKRQELEDSISTKMDFLKERGTCTIKTISIAPPSVAIFIMQTLSFDGDELVITHQKAFIPDNRTGGIFKEIYHIDPKSINPDRLRYTHQATSPGFQGDSYNIFIEMKNGAKNMLVENWSHINQSPYPPNDPVNHTSSGLNGMMFRANDEATAQEMVNALRDLIELRAQLEE